MLVLACSLPLVLLEIALRLLRADPARQLRHRTLPGASPDARPFQCARLRRLDQDQRVHHPCDDVARSASATPEPRTIDQADVFRVLLLGDSFVEAVQVEASKTVAARLESALQQQSSRRVEVINAGVAGYGPARRCCCSSRRERSYTPQVVVVVVFLGNDIGDNSYRHDPQRGEPTSRPTFEFDNERMIRVIPGAMPEAAPIRATSCGRAACSTTSLKPACYSNSAMGRFATSRRSTSTRATWSGASTRRTPILRWCARGVLPSGYSA